MERVNLPLITAPPDYDAGWEHDWEQLMRPEECWFRCRRCKEERWWGHPLDGRCPIHRNLPIPTEMADWGISGWTMGDLSKPKIRGRIQADTWINCGRCDYGMGWSDTGAREAARLAREDGWRYTRADGWVCPGCLNPPRLLPPEAHKLRG